jgi:DNA-binding Lrp family transcriptional regulator
VTLVPQDTDSASLDQRLLNDYQRGFPLVPEPFEHIAAQLGASAGDVINRLQVLQADGTVSRVGPVFRPNTIGASTLCAMAVPPAQLEKVAQTINGFAEVNHNYERDHRFNLWFVLTAASETALEDAIGRIESACGYALLSLPLERDYHIDLGFHMSAAACATRAYKIDARPPRNSHPADADDARLIGAIQSGLTLVERPFEVVAQHVGCSESAVLERIGELLGDGVIKRFGVVVRHHELGYRANAMVVWDVPDARVDALGRQLGALPCVTLCYRRRRQSPQWDFNLYCMIHGRERGAVHQRIEQLIDEHDMAGYAHSVLFSQRRFKQRGAHYRISDSTIDTVHGLHGHA